jgi:hypothetical protein
MTRTVRTVRPAAQAEPQATTASPACEGLVLIECLHWFQLNWVDDVTVTVTYPVGSDAEPDGGTVLSAQPDGSWVLVARLNPDGTWNAGAYERARLQLPDRVIFAPLGSKGSAWVVPYTNVIPNV